MKLVANTVTIGLASGTIGHYRGKGYALPPIVPRGTRITVLVSDLPKHSNQKVLVKCLDCEREVLQVYHWHLKGTTDYCRDCNLVRRQPRQDLSGQRFNRLLAVRNTGKVNKGGNYLWYCKCDCGGEKITPATYLKEGLVQSCGCLSKESSYNNMEKLIATQGVGDKSPTWNPLLTDEDRKRGRYEAEYDQFHKDVLVRDDYTCKACGAKERLYVHHILGYTKHPELRHTVNNGITLCKGCHYGTHRGAKMQDCNAEMLAKFLEMTRLVNTLNGIPM